MSDTATGQPNIAKPDNPSEKREYYRESGELLFRQRTNLILDNLKYSVLIFNINRKGVALGISAAKIPHVESNMKLKIVLDLHAKDEIDRVAGRIVVKKVKGSKAMIGVMFDEFIDPNRYGNFLDMRNVASLGEDNVSGLTPDSPEMDKWDPCHYPTVTL